MIEKLSPQQPIGVFDSGVGGLTVARKIKELMPSENIIYFGDTEHLPYGEKSKEAIVEYSVRIANFLLEQNCKAIVIACNTATANALAEVENTVKNRAFVFDVIAPVAKKVAEENPKKVGVIATKATTKTSLYRKSIQHYNETVEVQELATPLLVPAIEEGFTDHPIIEAILNHYLSEELLQNINSLILGCTHYPLLAQKIVEFYKGKIEIIDSPEIVAKNVKNNLEKHHLLNTENKKPFYHFYFSDTTDNIRKISTNFFGNEIKLELKKLR